MMKLKTFDEWLQENDQQLYKEIWGANALKRAGGAMKRAAMPLAVAGGMALGGMAHAPAPQHLDSQAILQQLNAAMNKGDHQLALKLTQQLDNSINGELGGLQGKMDSALGNSGRTLDAANKEFQRRSGFEPESDVDAFVRNTQHQPDPNVDDFIRNTQGK